MKISAEVREFARLNPSPLEGEGDSALPSGVRGSFVTEAEAESGMAEMSEKYREGGDLYVPAAE